ncbi:MAG: long-chain fatty acid--CoA ligase [Gammaproteobacteria bacterium]|nr:MAG: long-chain fatty acid--CoA ligase [Gammaproteobacteria bacterium]
MNFPIFDFLEKRAEIDPERIALEDIVTGDRVNYGELNLRVGRTAALLRALGVTAGDRVALLCRNRIEFFELLFACARLGAILVPLNWRMPISEIAPLLMDSGAGVLIHSREDMEVAQGIASLGSDGFQLQYLDLDDAGESGFRSCRDAFAPLEGRAVWPCNDTWYLLYTSGTTGKPRAVIQTFGMALANYINISQAMGLRGDDTTLNYLPLFHTGGINLVTLPTLIMGGRVLLTHGFDLELTVDLLESGELDSFFGVPAIYQAISVHLRFAELDLSRVRSWGCGGAPMPDPLLQQFAARGATVQNGMGMTETGPTVFLMDKKNALRKIGSVGKPQLLASVRLVDADGKDVARGEAGELWFSGAAITPGYYNRPEATAEALTDGNWLRSGDIGRQDDDGYYYIVGRLKDMFISGGENVFPAEIENQLAKHPDVLEAAIVAVEDEKWGEVGCAYILARPGHSQPPDAELATFCRQRLAAYKIPKYFLAVEDFPRTAAGKVQKHLLTRPEAES